MTGTDLFLEAEEAGSSTQESQGAALPDRDLVDDEKAEQKGGDSDDEFEFEHEGDSEYDENGNEKDPVYHWQIWRQLLRLACMREKGGEKGLLRYGSLVWSYSNNQADQIAVNRAPDRGADPLDVTAPISSQMHWDLKNRVHWPPRLHLWNRPISGTNPMYDIGVMRYKGHVVLDTAGKPIRGFRIPLIISSQIEGLRIEAWMRSDDRLLLGDIEARLWTKDAPEGGRRPFYGRRTLSKRASDARTRAGLISWVPKKGRDAQTDFMDQLRTPEQRARNEARYTDLTTQQKHAYAKIGLDENKESTAPSRKKRIRKIKQGAAGASASTSSTSGAANVGSAGDPMMVDSEDDSVGDESDSKLQTERRVSDEESVSSDLVDPLDSRNDQPTSLEEETLLQRALEITVDSFVSFSGQQPEMTNRGENYFSQWAILQEQHRVLWTRRQHNSHTDENDGSSNAPPVPMLRGRGRWTGGISQFENSEEILDDWSVLEEDI